MDRGALVSDEIMIGIIRRCLARDDVRPGFVLDGFPRTLPQAEALDAMMVGRDPIIVLDIMVSSDEVLRRIGARHVCSQCGAIFGDGALTAVCTRCGGELVRRSDDRESGRPRTAQGLRAGHGAADAPLPGPIDVCRDRRRRFARRGRAGGGGCSRSAARCGLARANREGQSVIVCRSPDELERMWAANKVVAGVLEELRTLAAPGMTTAELDAAVEARVREAGGTPAFKGYRGYPATLCASVNDEVVHGIPSGRKLVSGDLVSLDVGVLLDGYYGDSAITLGIGTISEEAAALLRVTQEALELGIGPGPGRRAGLGHRSRRAAPRGGARLFRGAGVRRTRYRHETA